MLFVAYSLASKCLQKMDKYGRNADSRDKFRNESRCSDQIYYVFKNYLRLDFTLFMSYSDAEI